MRAHVHVALGVGIFIQVEVAGPLMKAAICTRYGPPDVIEIREVPKPEPKAVRANGWVTITSTRWARAPRSPTCRPSRSASLTFTARPQTPHALVVNAFARYPRAVMAGQTSIRPGPWNVSVTVGAVDAFRAAFLATQPSLTVMVDAIASVRPGDDESKAVEAAFARLPGVLSPGVAALAPQRCLVVPLVAGQLGPSSR